MHPRPAPVSLDDIDGGPDGGDIARAGLCGNTEGQFIAIWQPFSRRAVMPRRTWAVEKIRGDNSACRKMGGTRPGALGWVSPALRLE